MYPNYSKEIIALHQKLTRQETLIVFLFKYFGLSYVLNISRLNDPDIMAALREGNLPEALRLYTHNEKHGNHAEEVEIFTSGDSQ